MENVSLWAKTNGCDMTETADIRAKSKQNKKRVLNLEDTNLL